MPLRAAQPVKQEIVLFKFTGNAYPRLVKTVNSNRFQIGDKRCGINGWTALVKVVCRGVRVEPWAMHGEPSARQGTHDV